MVHDCKYESEIAESRKEIKAMYTIICGNGKFGLVHQVGLMKWVMIGLILRFVFEIPFTNIAQAFIK